MRWNRQPIRADQSRAPFICGAVLLVVALAPAAEAFPIHAVFTAEQARHAAGPGDDQALLVHGPESFFDVQVDPIRPAPPINTDPVEVDVPLSRGFQIGDPPRTNLSQLIIISPGESPGERRIGAGHILAAGGSLAISAVLLDDDDDDPSSAPRPTTPAQFPQPQTFDEPFVDPDDPVDVDGDGEPDMEPEPSVGSADDTPDPLVPPRNTDPPVFSDESFPDLKNDAPTGPQEPASDEPAGVLTDEAGDEVVVDLIDAGGGDGMEDEDDLASDIDLGDMDEIDEKKQDAFDLNETDDQVLVDAGIGALNATGSPEPTTAGLAAFGLAALGWRTRRDRGGRVPGRAG